MAGSFVRGNSVSETPYEQSRCWLGRVLKLSVAPSIRGGGEGPNRNCDSRVDGADSQLSGDVSTSQMSGYRTIGRASLPLPFMINPDAHNQSNGKPSQRSPAEEMLAYVGWESLLP